MSPKRVLLFLITSITAFLCLSAAADVVHPFTPRLVKIYDESELDSLSKEGVEVLRRRGDILLCLFPNNQTRGGGSRLFSPRKNVPALDVAKRYYNAYSIQDGSAAGQPYTGKGVVVGICDLGIDPLHPTFLDSEGKSRIKRIVQYKELEGKRTVVEGDDAYREWQTDSIDEFHATHVCAILAGRGAGTPYSGIATDADIVVTTSNLTDVGLLAGVEDIIDYAKQVGKRAVINISVGSYVGPHDGSTLFSQYLDMCTDDAVIVMSAGNEGRHANTLMGEFSESQPSVSFRLGNKNWNQFEMRGATDIWSGNSQPFAIHLRVFDDDLKDTVLDLGSFTAVPGERVSFEWCDEDCQSGLFPFAGALEVEGEVDSENGRYHAMMAYDFRSPVESKKGGWAQYDLAVEVAGAFGNDVEVYADGIHTRLVSMPKNPRASTERTISDLACGPRVISVGMYGNRSLVPLSDMSGSFYEEPTGYEDGETVSHSSYGTLRDGRVLPLTVAPGATLMSAASRPFLEAYPDYPHLDLGSPWISEGGTSMSSPYVAGYIAAWIEAVPDLDIEDIMRIITESNHREIPQADDPRNANGYFDPVMGLRMALGLGGVESIDHPGALLQPDDIVTVFNMAGAKVYAGPVWRMAGIVGGLYVIHTPLGVMKASLPLR